MKKLLLLLCALLAGVSGVWADGTWSSGNTAGDASGQLSTIGWVKIKTPTAESGIKFTSFTFKHMGTNQKNARLAISATKLDTSTGISASTFAGISNGFSGTTSPNVKTYDFDSDVVLYGNSWYYLYFLTDNADGVTYDLSTNGVAVQTGLSLTGDDRFFYSGSVIGDESNNNSWKPYYTCTYTSVDLSTVTVTYSCENLSGYTLVASTNTVIGTGTKFTPPSAPTGYTLDGVYDDTDAAFDYANTNINADKTLKLKYHLTTNPLESNKSTVAAPTWCTIRIGTGSGKEYLYPNESDVPFILFSGTSITYPIADKYLWCIEGNETDGYMLYNKAKSQYLGRTDAYYGSTTTAYKLALVDDDPGNNPRWTFIYANSGYRLYSVTDNSHVNRSGTTPHYWSSGITYNSNEVDDALTLYQTNYPYSTIVNTAGYVGGYESADVAAAQTAVSSTEPTTVDAYASFVTPLGSKVALQAGYYRLVSALAGFKSNQGVNKALTIYSGNTAYPGWETYDASSAKQIFHLTYESSAWHLQNVSNGKYLVVPNEYNWITFSDSGTDLTMWDFGSSMYSIGINADRAIHAYNHNGGVVDGEKGNQGMLVAYYNDEYPSLWYLEKVTLPTITMISPSAVDAESDVYMSYANNTGADKQMPAGVTVYKVLTGGTKSDVTLTEVTSKVVPDGEGVILKATKGATIPLLPTTTAEALTGNMLEAGDGSAVSGYLLAYQNGVDAEPKFYKMNSVALADNKAYLPSSYFSAEVKTLSLVFDDATAINSIEDEKSDANGTIFNLAGQRMNRLQKGVNIVNGKKVLVK